MTKFPKLLMLLAMMPLISGCSSYTSIRQHKEFAKTFPQYNSVAIVPSYIFVNQITKDGTKTVKPTPQQISNVMQMAQKQLASSGYTITEVISDDEMESNDNFNDSYKGAIRKLYKNKDTGNIKSAFKTNETIGSASKYIALNSHSDLLLVLGYEGSEMSQSEVTKNLAKDMAWAMIGAQQDTHIKDGSAIISLVERKTGNLLWSNIGTDFENYGSSVARIITKNNVMETAFANALKDLPDKTKAAN